METAAWMFDYADARTRAILKPLDSSDCIRRQIKFSPHPSEPVYREALALFHLAPIMEPSPS